MKKLKAGDEDLEMSAENLMVKSAEMLDYMSSIPLTTLSSCVIKKMWMPDV